MSVFVLKCRSSHLFTFEFQSLSCEKLLFWQVVSKVAKNMSDWPKHHPISLQQDFQSHSTGPFLLMGFKPCNGTCPIHHRLLDLVTELKLWLYSLGDVLQLLHCSIFVCLGTLGIVLDLFWCRVITAFQCLLTSITYKNPCRLAFQLFCLWEDTVLLNNISLKFLL